MKLTVACGSVTFVGKLGYFSCAILSINSDACAPPHGILIRQLIKRQLTRELTAWTC